MTASVATFDPAAASDDELRELHDFMNVIEREREPGDPLQPFDVAVVDYREPPAWTKNQFWVGRDVDGAIVGAAWLELEYVETNRHLAWFDIGVRADRRGQGIGSALLGEITSAARADGRSVIGATVVGDDATGADAPFLRRFGFDQRMVERRSRLLTDELDRSMLEDWLTRAKERASEYSMFGFDDDCPEEIIDAYCAVTEVMNTAPREDLDMEDWHLTPERLRVQQQRHARKRESKWTLIARHDPTGALAGFTEINFGKWMGDLAWQGGTGVDPAHRDKGLGRWLKAAMALRLLDERPDIKRVDTWNAGSNRPMLGINVAMGFKPLRYYGDWQAELTA